MEIFVNIWNKASFNEIIWERCVSQDLCASKMKSVMTCRARGTEITYRILTSMLCGHLLWSNLVELVEAVREYTVQKVLRWESPDLHEIFHTASLHVVMILSGILADSLISPLSIGRNRF